MSETGRTVPSTLGVALLVVVLVSFMGAMVRGGMMDGMAAGPWAMAVLALVVVAAGVALLVLGPRRPVSPRRG